MLETTEGTEDTETSNHKFFWITLINNKEPQARVVE